MQLEIQVALNFIISYLYNKLPRRRVNIFGEELERLLKKKYEGHWYPEKPYKGSGFRCIHVGEKVDPVIEQASKESGLAQVPYPGRVLLGYSSSTQVSNSRFIMLSYFNLFLR